MNFATKVFRKNAEKRAFSRPKKDNAIIWSQNGNGCDTGFESNIKHAGKRIDFTANKNRKKLAHAGSAILFRKISLKLPCSRDHLLMPWVIKLGKITSKCPSFINKTLMGHVLRFCWHVLTKWHQVRVEMCRNKSSQEICERRLLKICPSTAY